MGDDGSAEVQDKLQDILDITMTSSAFAAASADGSCLLLGRASAGGQMRSGQGAEGLSMNHHEPLRCLIHVCPLQNKKFQEQRRLQNWLTPPPLSCKMKIFEERDIEM